jgi:subtilase family serine protease
VGELWTAYDLGGLYYWGLNGAGQTVVIVDAYGSPTIYSDLLSFIQWQNANGGANLPWTTLAQVESHLHIYYPLGNPGFPYSNGDAIGWSMEVTLDVDMVHAIAPGANIALVIAPNDNWVSLEGAVNYAVVHRLGCAISQSWGLGEYWLSGPAGETVMVQSNSIYMAAAKAGITVFASSGDDGAANYAPVNNPMFPASDPFVTAVGGTNLFMYCANTRYYEGTDSWPAPTGSTGSGYYYEIAGNDYEGQVADGYPTPSDYVTTGGAMSSFFALPSWQRGITLTYASTGGGGVGSRDAFKPTGRCTSDVSWDSGVYGGLGAVPWSVIPAYAGNYIIGGTSAGSPAWAALTAIACQYAGHSLGCINAGLYGLYFSGKAYSSGAFHDITSGDNTYPYGSTPVGFAATPGWDPPTGIGSPDAYNLIWQMHGW